MTWLALLHGSDNIYRPLRRGIRNIDLIKVLWTLWFWELLDCDFHHELTNPSFCRPWSSPLSVFLASGSVWMRFYHDCQPPTAELCTFPGQLLSILNFSWFLRYSPLSVFPPPRGNVNKFRLQKCNFRSSVSLQYRSGEETQWSWRKSAFRDRHFFLWQTLISNTRIQLQRNEAWAAGLGTS